jgi:hypothetical protein
MTEDAKIFAKQENDIINNYINPLINKLEKENKDEYVLPIPKLKGSILIYPSDLNVVLCPLLAEGKDHDAVMKYFILVRKRGEEKYNLYEWTYFKQERFNDSQTMDTLTEEINRLTYWKYSAQTLNDNFFWNKYVLAKSNGHYKYLKSIPNP